jgi:hypothetical protein
MSDVTTQEANPVPEWMKTDAGVMERVEDLKKISKYESVASAVGFGMVAGLLVAGIINTPTILEKDMISRSILTIFEAGAIAFVTGYGVLMGISAMGHKLEAGAFQAALIRGMKEQELK